MVNKPKNMREGGPRFGEDFNPDMTNRLDVKNIRKGRIDDLSEGDIPDIGLEQKYVDRADVVRLQDLPEYIDLSWQIRDQLKSTVETQGWPECPKDVLKVEDLFEAARAEVAQRWLSTAAEVLGQQAAKWLAGIPDNEENKELRKALASPGLLEENLRVQDLSNFENLREAIPEAWRSLVLASSERQLAAVVLMRRWIKELPEASLEKMGVGRAEIQLMLDTAGMVGKFIDQAYIKQIELADAPGGSEETTLGLRAGAKYMYDLQSNPASDAVNKKTYKDVFATEWPRLVKRLEVLADRTDELLTDGKVPETYAGLPAYLRQMTQVYNSDSVSPKQLEKMWSELEAGYIKLAETGCPIIIIPQGCAMVAGEADKVDVEMRLGFQTPETKELGQVLNELRPLAQEIVDANKAALKEPYQVPPIVLTNQPFAFGPDAHFMTEGESGTEAIVSHLNVTRETVIGRKLPLIKKTIAGAELDQNSFVNSSSKDTVLHELGHTVMAEEDSHVKRRRGVSDEAAVVEELKAETVGVALLMRKLEQDKPADADKIIEQQLLAKIAALEEYLLTNSGEKGSEGERYYYSAVAIIKELLDRQVLVPAGDKYQVTDARAGMQAIAAMGMDVINRFYTNIKDDPATVRKGVKEHIVGIRKQAQDEAVAKFIKLVKE
ncbi:MAG: hypothetical protein WC480_00725 [Patescibacteria group bacterium]